MPKKYIERVGVGRYVFSAYDWLVSGARIDRERWRPLREKLRRAQGLGPAAVIVLEGDDVERLRDLLRFEFAAQLELDEWRRREAAARAAEAEGATPNRLLQIYGMQRRRPGRAELPESTLHAFVAERKKALAEGSDDPLSICEQFVRDGLFTSVRAGSQWLQGWRTRLAQRRADLVDLSRDCSGLPLEVTELDEVLDLLKRLPDGRDYSRAVPADKEK